MVVVSAEMGRNTVSYEGSSGLQKKKKKKTAIVSVRDMFRLNQGRVVFLYLQGCLVKCDSSRTPK